MIRDPAMVRIGRGLYVCVVCGETLPDLCVKQQDPFCSTKCCKDFHGVEIQENHSKRGAPVGASS